MTQSETPSEFAGPVVLVLDGRPTLQPFHEALAAFSTAIGRDWFLQPQNATVFEGDPGAGRTIVAMAFPTEAEAEAAVARKEFEPLATMIANTAPGGSPETSGRITLFAHGAGPLASIDPAPGSAILVVNGKVSDRDSYFVYLRALGASGILVRHGMERVVVMNGPAAIRRRILGSTAVGEYFELLRFPTFDAVHQFWHSDEYATMIDMRRECVVVTAMVLAADVV